MSAPFTKSILVLANSIKKGGRCVAGVEADLVEGNRYQLGRWIRPVDPNQREGTIPSLRTFLDARYLKPLDLVRIQFLQSADDPHHPEDVEIDGSKSWSREGFMAFDALAVIPDNSEDLWGAQSAYTRKVTPAPGMKTLRLIRPTGVCYVLAYREETPWGPKNRRYLYLSHQGVMHEFSVDDPFFGDRHNLSPAAVGTAQVKIDLDPARTVVIASLTKPYEKDGMQYKIAASIIEQ